jgi:hypothetical protein
MLGRLNLIYITFVEYKLILQLLITKLLTNILYYDYDYDYKTIDSVYFPKTGSKYLLSFSVSLYLKFSYANRM